METIALPTYKNVHNRFKFNGTHFTHEELKEVAYSLIKEGEAYERVLGDFMMDWLLDKPYVNVQTSGSTGTPKMIQVDKQAMVASALATGDFFKIPVGAKALHCLPANYIAGKMMLVRAIILGWEIDVVPPNSTPLAEITTNYDFAAMIPLQVENSLANISAIKKVIVGGAPMSATLKAKLQELPTRFYETYGMTETVTHIAVKKVNRFSKKKTTQDFFKTIKGVNISQDDRGCLVIKAPHLTGETIVTNDVVEILSKRRFIWKGRADNVINSGGVKLFPEQIEAKLVKVIDAPLMVGSVDDTTLGQKLVLLVASENLTIAQIEAEIAKAQLERFEHPKEIYIVNALAETPNGKLDRKATMQLIS